MSLQLNLPLLKWRWLTELLGSLLQACPAHIPPPLCIIKLKLCDASVSPDPPWPFCVGGIVGFVRAAIVVKLLAGHLDPDWLSKCCSASPVPKGPADMQVVLPGCPVLADWKVYACISWQAFPVAFSLPHFIKFPWEKSSDIRNKMSHYLCLPCL